MMGGGPEETHGGLGQGTEGKRGTAEALSTSGGGAETGGWAQWTPQPAHLNVCGGTGPVEGEGAVRKGSLLLVSTSPLPSQSRPPAPPPPSDPGVQVPSPLPRAPVLSWLLVLTPSGI